MSKHNFKAHNLDRDDMFDKAFPDNQIEQEAAKLYPDNNVTGNPLTYGKRIGYKDAAKKYLPQIIEKDKEIERLRGLLRKEVVQTGGIWKNYSEINNL